MAGKQVTELDALPSFTDNSLLPVHNGAGLKKGLLSQLANYLGKKFNNPNLLINPDFKINQREKSTYTAETVIYTVDRWKAWHVTVNINKNGYINIENNAYQDEGILRQQLESTIDGPSTLSCYVESVSGTVKIEAPNNDSKIILKQGLNILHVDGNVDSFKFTIIQGSNVTLKWAKLEQGSIATPFVAPNSTEELLKCQRFYEVVNVNCKPIASVGEIYIFIPCVKKRVNPSVTMEGSKNVWFGNKEYGLTFKRSELDNSNIKVVFSTDTGEWGVGFMKNMLIKLDAEIY